MQNRLQQGRSPRVVLWLSVGALVLTAALFGPPAALGQRGLESGYVDEASTRLPAMLLPGLALAIGDVDGDGDLDVFMGTDIGPSRDVLLLNDGRGFFEDDSVRRLPPKEADVFTRGAQLADLDNDGDLDLVIALARRDPGTGRVSGERNQIFINDGRGFFKDETAVRMPGVPVTEQDDPSYSVVAGDINGDGALDFFVANNLNRPDRLWTNDGRGIFSDQSTFLPPTAETLSSASADMGDIDGDGDLDIVVGVGVAREGVPHIFINDGSGRFDDQTNYRLGNEQRLNSWQTRLIDVDGDRDLDLIFCNTPTRAMLFTNNGLGFFSDETTLKFPFDAAACMSVDAGDFDGDGDLDLALGRDPDDPTVRRNLLLINSDGLGHFIATPLTGDGGANAIAFFDADGDGDLDLIGVNRGEHHLWINKR